MIPMIYLLILVAILFLIGGFYIKNPVLLVLSAILLIILGVYILGNGLEGTKDFAVDALGIIFICLGSYVFIRTTLEQVGDL